MHFLELHKQCCNVLARALLLEIWRSKQTVLHMFEGANDLQLSLLCFYLLSF